MPTKTAAPSEPLMTFLAVVRLLSSVSCPVTMHVVAFVRAVLAYVALVPAISPYVTVTPFDVSLHVSLHQALVDTVITADVGHACNRAKTIATASIDNEV